VKLEWELALLRRAAELWKGSKAEALDHAIRVLAQGLPFNQRDRAAFAIVLLDATGPA
jgi:hypothetical protein